MNENDRIILVTAIGGDVGNGIVKCLENSKSTIIGCDMVKYPVGLNRVHHHFQSLSALDENYIPNIIEQCKNYGITHVFPVSELEIKRINENRDVFADIGIKLIINNEEIIQKCLDKYVTSNFLIENGYNAPKSYIPETFIETGETYIVKYRSSCGSRLLKLIKTKEEVMQLAQGNYAIVIQQYIDIIDQEYTVGVFSDGLEVRTVIFKRELYGGYTKFVELVEDDSISNDATRIAKLFNLRGSFNIQLRKYENKNYIFEINPRISGTVYFRHLIDFTDVLWWIALVENEPVQPQKQHFKTAIGIRELTEKYLIKEI